MKGDIYQELGAVVDILSGVLDYVNSKGLAGPIAEDPEALRKSLGTQLTVSVTA